MKSELGSDHIEDSPQQIIREQNVIKKFHIVALDPMNIELALLNQYIRVRANKGPHGYYDQLIARFNQVGEKIILVCLMLWREIMPQFFRGVSELDNHDEAGDEKEKQIFEQYRKKRVKFFLIVRDTSCSEEQIQQAYEKASFMMEEGFCLSLTDLYAKTNCIKWTVPSLFTFKKYLIVFMKFDCFDHLLYFGQLEQEGIQSVQGREREMEFYKEELDEIYNKYQQIELGFIGSYVEKEDKFLFE